MENLSKLTIDDSASSMYFSFNSSAANKTLEAMESGTGTSCVIDEEESEQNITLEAKENAATMEEVHTVKKFSFVSPKKAIPKNILTAYKALSSTPTKAQLLRSVEVTRGSAAVDVCELGLAFLDAPQERINELLSEDKENQPQESLEINSETSSEIVVSVIEKTQEEEKPTKKRVGFSNLPLLSESRNSKICGTPEAHRFMPRSMPDLEANRPSRILPKKAITTKGKCQDKDSGADNIPKMISSMLKISKELSTKEKPLEKPFNLVGKGTRMSIVKTTLNSPARRPQRKSITAVSVGRKPMRQSMAAISKRKSMAPEAVAVTQRSMMPVVGRKSMLTTSVTSPKKPIVASRSESSRSALSEKATTSMIPTSRKSMAYTKSKLEVPKQDQPDSSKQIKIKKPRSAHQEEFVCAICIRKFRVLSLFEAHKRSHNTAGTSTKQNFYTNDKQCRYCDKKFAIVKALSNHLIENCTKIPPGDKKKLLFPSDQPVHSAGQIQSQMPLKSHSNYSSCESLSANSAQFAQKQLDAKSSDTSDRSMLPPSVNKVKKKMAHSGVYCTPNKQIPCHICKISFSNILAYAEHSLSHDDDAVATVTEATQTQVEMKNDGTQTLQEEGVLPLN